MYECLSWFALPYCFREQPIYRYPCPASATPMQVNAETREPMRTITRVSSMPSSGEVVVMKQVYRGLVGTAIVAATAASPGGLFEPNATLVVPKTVISSKMRFVFAAGLQGTGHHYFDRVNDHLFETNQHLVHIPARKVVHRSFYDIDHSMARNLEHYEYITQD